MADNYSFRKFLNPISLSFRDKILEQDFLEYYKNNIVGHVRIAMIIALGLYSVFACLDLFLFPEFAASFFQIRFYLVTPIFIIAFLSTFHPSFFKHFQLLISICVIIAAYGVIAMLYIGGSEVNTLYYVGLMLVLIFNYDFLKLRFLSASIVGALILLCYIVVSLFNKTSPNILVASLFFLVSANIMGMFSAYFYEFLNRKFFYSNLLLQEEKKKTINLNFNLEKQVEERTANLIKTNKELIKAKEVAQESDRLKSVFLATMSHELRTPLNAIIGFSEFLGSDDSNEADNKSMAQIIHRSGNHLLSLVESLFDITLIDSGQIELKKDKFLLIDLMKDVENIIKHEQILLNKSSLTLIFDQANIKSDFMIYSDKYKIKQILINLLKNALKFTETGGIKFWCEEISGYNRPYLKFYVKDSGIGIPKDKTGLIFEIFRQVDDSHSRKYEGIGIGLSVVKKLVEMLGGQVGVDSIIDKGSTFYFTIYDYSINEEN